jgi:hypothetical protein
MVNVSKTRRSNLELQEFSHSIQEIVPSWGGAEGFPQSCLKVSHQHDLWMYCTMIAFIASWAHFRRFSSWWNMLWDPVTFALGQPIFQWSFCPHPKHVVWERVGVPFVRAATGVVAIYVWMPYPG